MKILKLLLFVLSLSASAGVNAQSWFPPGATWYYHYSGYMVASGYEHMTIYGDTLINGQQAHRLDITVNSVHVIYGQSSYTYEEYVYADEDRVYWYHHDMFNLLYDFSAEVGDTLEIYATHNYGNGYEDCDSAVVVVDSTGILDINGVTHRWYTTTPTPSSNWYFEGRNVEGIGSMEVT